MYFFSPHSTHIRLDLSACKIKLCLFVSLIFGHLIYRDQQPILIVFLKRLKVAIFRASRLVSFAGGFLFLLLRDGFVIKERYLMDLMKI